MKKIDRYNLRFPQKSTIDFFQEERNHINYLKLFRLQVKYIAKLFLFLSASNRGF